jgi:hypothetical protein
MKNRFNIYLIAIILLSLSQAFMHVNFLVGNENIKTERYNEQIAIADGMMTHFADFQSRLLFPNMLKVIGAVMPQQVLSERYHAGLSLAFAEWISIFFSLTGLFLLSNEIFRSRLKSFFVIVFYSIYLPYIFQLPHRFGEALIFGFFCFLAYAVLARKQILFIGLLVLCSFQRVDIAFISVVFKIIYEFFEHGKKYKTVFVNSLLFIIPWIVISWITNFYKLNTADALLEPGLQLIRANIRYMPVIIFCYLPISVLSVMRFRRFDKRVYYLLFSLLPYLSVVFVIGAFSESRLLHPLIVTLIIGIISSVKDTEIHDFVDSELSVKT